ncbi:MAG: hypothetical protein AAGB97_06020 [Dehalococcoidia bacterium]|nr:hypothetical protein [Chloroflexota bacterium]MBT9160619.1 hypothetical protein [Chloroflexota bacterium]MBT9162701.1 hypothetical protein [Chloroflexota bacterium]
MARRGNYSHRESKKPKSGAKKPKGVTSVLPIPVAVEVIKKARKHKPAETETQEEE